MSKDIVLGLAEAYANRFPTSPERKVSLGRAKVIARGLDDALRGQKRRRAQRLLLLEVIFDRPFRSTKDLLEPEGVALLRWLYNLGEDTPLSPGAKPDTEKSASLLELLTCPTQ